MNLEQIAWIQENVDKYGGYGKCKEISSKMQKTFPELKQVRGHYHCPIWGKRQHWWLIDANGAVVDPTAAQFPSKGRFEYEIWDESLPQPTGKCPNCGGYCYDHKYLCCKACEIAYEAYCNGA